MKKRTFIPFVISVILVILSVQSCGPSYSEEIDDIDSMLTLLNEKSKQLQEFPVEMVNAKNDTFLGIYAAIDTVYNFLERDSNFYTVNTFINLQKPLRRHKTRGVKLMEDVDYQITQLENLRKDIKTKSRSKEEIERYLSLESAECEKVVQFATAYYNMMKSQIATFDSLSPQIKELVILYSANKK
ncbi:MAG: hypothetical protein RBS19_06725 [Bacteroidales bacterium]|nr:hypothetical protein [Bacteroidales bacterium]MDY0216630.1 hypothetical protein [Bacteroidales bacterium]